jgi:hypothetical protein
VHFTFREQNEVKRLRHRQRAVAALVLTAIHHHQNLTPKSLKNRNRLTKVLHHHQTQKSPTTPIFRRVHYQQQQKPLN